jgi:adenylate cyclase
MAEDQTNRRLAAILAADVVGYSKMMGADEAGTLSALKHHRETIFDPNVARHNGRVFKLIGDGTLVEFASVVDAVKCAIAIQRAVIAAASTAGSNIVLRIGINLGDVIIDGDDVYGDGVNVAARLEPLAEAGGVCIASIVNESVGNRIEIAFKDGGEVTVKNITRPIRVWKWHPSHGSPAVQPVASVTQLPKTQPEPPSIAVLPFDNMSGDREQEYFSDGITEDIITDLSKVGGLLVIARNSSFAYKGKSTDIRTVGRELGVRAVLEGSIRRAGNRVRITAQLIDVTTGGHLWAERYDRDVTDIFAVQDEVTRHIVDALSVKLKPGEAASTGAPTSSPEAHDLYLRGRELLRGDKKDRESFDEMVSLMSRAIALDPDYAEPYAGLAMAYNLDFHNGWTGAPDALEKAVHFAALGAKKGPEISYCRTVAATMALWSKDLDRAKLECEAALRLSPNDSSALGGLGIVEIYLGNPDAAIPWIERAIRLDPGFAQQAMHFLGTAYLVAGKYEIAAATFRERIRLSPKSDFSRGLLISALGHLGEMEAARGVAAELQEISPTYSFAAHLARLPFRNAADAQRIADGFSKAGLAA